VNNERAALEVLLVEAAQLALALDGLVAVDDIDARLGLLIDDGQTLPRSFRPVQRLPAGAPRRRCTRRTGGRRRRGGPRRPRASLRRDGSFSWSGSFTRRRERSRDASCGCPADLPASELFAMRLTSWRVLSRRDHEGCLLYMRRQCDLKHVNDGRQFI
jgi:hypothetical protein